VRVFPAYCVPVHGKYPALQSFRFLRFENGGRFALEDEPQRVAKFACSGPADKRLDLPVRRILIARYEFVCFFLLVKRNAKGERADFEIRACPVLISTDERRANKIG
jgi:hypothetical protein